MHHADASACLLVNGILVAAVEEERFTRIKHYSGFPIQAVDYCLQHAGVSLYDIDHLVVGRDPNAKFKEKMAFFVKAPSQLLKKYLNTEEILLITSAMHMPRSILCFEKVGFNVKAYPVDKKGSLNELGILDLITPSDHNLTRTSQLIREISGLLIYKVMGYC